MTRPDPEPPPIPFLLLLTAAAACGDAFSFLGFRGTFTANMTGNTILLALALARSKGEDVSHAGTALLGFLIGAVAATMLLRRAPRERGTVRDLRIPIVVELALLIVVTTVWIVVGLHRSMAVDLGMIGLTGIVMGIQSAAVRSLPGAGVSTTFITGTWTDLASGWVDRRTRSRGWKVRAATIGSYVGGAAAGGLLLRFVVSWAAPMLSIAFLVAAAAITRAG
ncbi:MAG TPA: YoaK family protein [Actinomycetota bacterium]|jgi:uncharacterized membrane protein YoaK (UPF0700 family)|nr:YoaK family protein [Actinomycetota bacterium]